MTSRKCEGTNLENLRLAWCKKWRHLGSNSCSSIKLAMQTLVRCLIFCASILPFVKWSKYLPHRVVVRIKLNETMYVKYLAQCLAHCGYSIKGNSS